jgi:hypothetical protein
MKKSLRRKVGLCIRFKRQRLFKHNFNFWRNRLLKVKLLRMLELESEVPTYRPQKALKAIVY